MKGHVKFLVLILIVVSLLVTGCSTEDETEMQTLRIGSLPIEDILPIVVAEKMGFFEQENISVELIPFQSAVEAESAMQSGRLDGMVTDMIVAILLINSGLETKITSITLGTTPEEGRFAILAAPGTDFETLSDLKGKQVGISYNSIIEYVTDGLLEEAGFDTSYVDKVSVPRIPIRMEMLLNNQIDAITVPDPLVTFAESQGATVVADDTTIEKNLSQAVITLTEDAIGEKHEAIQGFYRAYTKAVTELNSNPEEFRNVFVENVNIPEPVADIYNIQQYPEPELPTENDINNVLNWLTEKDLLDGELSYEQLVDNSIY
ncbi:NitT/TauT family transport system substrate-binding protein [Desulfitispora alkaliphila]|uniref:ABC transporter substrate-binding protein n=1 Tax=Desulfitispora alkaliphila TaxID=622674 RepID=UPI003D1B5CF3